MQSFLEEVIDHLLKEELRLEELSFVLPSKRAGVFLKNHIARISQKTIFAPHIYSIEEFVGQISELSYATPTQQLFELYQTYREIVKQKADTFYQFSKWGTTLLQDFNEIDRYLVAPEKLFSYLAAINQLDHWSLAEEKTKMMRDHIHFWNTLDTLYYAFNHSLLAKGIGHQGLVYRTACTKLSSFLKQNSAKTYIFIGFNALNTAESTIIHQILEETASQIFWDIDPYFLKDPIHDAGYFIRKHQKSWNYYKNRDLLGPKENYLKPKDIRVVGVSKNVAQAQYLGNLLAELSAKKKDALSGTAVVLGDETLLNPIVNAIPKTISGVNITMGYPLSKTPLASLFTTFFTALLNKTNEGWFYQDIQALISHPYVQLLLTKGKHNYATLLRQEIIRKNWVYIQPHHIQTICKGNQDIAKLIFSEGQNSAEEILYLCQQIIQQLRGVFTPHHNKLELAYLHRFHELCNQLHRLIGTYTFIKDLKALKSIYTTLLSSETLDFRGEPLKGIQIMGMLESRNLDFDTVIISAVNEGILPSGKSNNSFIPFDVKNNFGLPTYKEKDAVYTYHFYRLLQRAKNIYLLYNTEPDVLMGGEKSRLITQLLMDENKAASISEFIAFPKVEVPQKELQIIEKDFSLLEDIKMLAGKGFSPSSLSNYIRNPIDFYKKHILKIQDSTSVEETIAANTFGTIVHDTLEELYTPLIGDYLTREKLNTIKPKIRTVALKQFTTTYGNENITVGKNLIAFEVIVRYITNFIDLEFVDVAHHNIKIIALEKSLTTVLSYPEINHPIVLKGKLDRIDERDGITHIIDYKTGKVSANQVKVADWDLLLSDYALAKPFQLLCYALLFLESSSVETIHAGILSFKNLKQGLLLCKIRESEASKTFSPHIDRTIVEKFKAKLKLLLLEILDPKTSLVEKEI